MSMPGPYINKIPIPPIQAGKIISINLGTPEYVEHNFVMVKALQFLKFSELKNKFLTESHAQRESCSNNNSKVVNWFKGTFLTTNKVEDKPFAREKQFIKWLEANGFIKPIIKNPTSNIECISIYLSM